MISPSRSQERSYIDEKIGGVEASVARIVTSIEERQREEAGREDMRALATCVREVKEGLDKNENKIGEIVVKIDELVSRLLSDFTTPMNLNSFNHSGLNQILI